MGHQPMNSVRGADGAAAGWWCSCSNVTFDYHDSITIDLGTLLQVAQHQPWRADSSCHVSQCLYGGGSTCSQVFGFVCR